MEECKHSAKLRSTVQRRVILGLIGDKEAPVTAEEIFEAAKSQLPKLALTTVYRNLDALAESGIIVKSTYNDGVARYEIAAAHKHYLVCLKCRKMILLPECPLKELSRKLGKSTGFEIAEHKLELYGYCAECKTKSRGAAK